MAIFASALILANIKPSIRKEFNFLYKESLIADNYSNLYAFANAFAIKHGFEDKIQHAAYATAAFGALHTNGTESYVSSALKDLALGFDKDTGNLVLENTFKSHIIVPTLAAIFDAIADSYAITIIDETGNSVFLSKNIKDLRKIYSVYSQDMLDTLGFDYELSEDDETRIVVHPEFDKDVSCLLSMVS